MKADEYDNFAQSYEAENASSLLNEYYERPTMIRLAGRVDGRRILDAGCGSGPLTAALRAQGAVMTGFDGSPVMLDLALKRLGPDVSLCVADLAEPLPFPDDAFDDVVVSLVFHYLGDWSGPLAEIHRVLNPGGRCIISVNHPLVRVFMHPDEDYFATRQYWEDYKFADEKVSLPHWHRPLHAMTDAFTAANFNISMVCEPVPAPDTPTEFLTTRILRGETTSFLSFIFFVLTAR